MQRPWRYGHMHQKCHIYIYTYIHISVWVCLHGFVSACLRASNRQYALKKRKCVGSKKEHAHGMQLITLTKKIISTIINLYLQTLDCIPYHLYPSTGHWTQPSIRHPVLWLLAKWDLTREPPNHCSWNLICCHPDVVIIPKYGHIQYTLYITVSIEYTYFI